YELGRRLGKDLGSPRAEDVWTELRSLSPMHAGVSYPRLAGLGGVQWARLRRGDPGARFIHRRLWGEGGENPAPLPPVEHDPPVDVLDDEFPLRLTTGRRLESFNTGVQTNRFSSPLHVGGEAILLAPEDGERYGVADGSRVRVVSRRGSVEAPARYDATLRPGLAFMNLPFPDRGATERPPIHATRPKAGPAAFKA